ncbi:MAG: 50S ribosomal protein L7ae [Euryarchaeota archaeon]|nr:50S ribosomal protein L7ae [Euryarchaeota archaeon]
MRLYHVLTPQRMLHEEIPMSVHIAFDTPQDIKDSVFELVKLVGKEGHGTVKKGANEVTKCAERQTAMMVIMAEDVNPPELLAHIPMICREKSIPFIYVDNQEYLAEYAGMSRGTKTAAIAILDVGREANDRFESVKEQALGLAK